MFATFLKKTNETCNDAETDFNDIGRKRNLAENKFRSDSTSLIFLLHFCPDDHFPAFFAGRRRFDVFVLLVKATALNSR